MKSESLTVQIKCTSNSSMYFGQSQSIHITSLEFVRCGGNQVKNVKEFLVNSTKFEGQEKSGTALELIETSSQIVNSTFVSNRKGPYRILIFPMHGLQFVGGAIIATSGTNINISNSKFKDNKADYGGAIFADNSIIHMRDNVSFVNNTASAGFGGALCSSRCAITINASTFSDNRASKFKYIGGVLWSFNRTIVIEASELHHNTAIGGSVLASLNSFITIKASQFDSNKGTGGTIGARVLYFYNRSNNIVKI